MRRIRAFSAAIATALIAFVAHAEQMQRVGDADVHYVVVPSMFLSAEIADQYELVRGKDRAFVNISVLRNDAPVTADVTGSYRNLLSQITALEFREVTEGDAVYYLAPLRHDDGELLRFAIRIDGRLMEFEQPVYWQESR